MLHYLLATLNKLFVLLIISLGFSCYSYANTISGTVSLPNGVVAGSGGVEISLSAFPFVDISTSFERVTIPQGQSAAQYSFNFVESQERSINFGCNFGCDSLDITTDGAWDNTLGVVGFLSGERFSGTENHIVNITLERADTFSGRLIFPENFAITGDEFLSVTVSSTSIFAVLDRYSFSTLLEKGESEVNFSVGAPTRSAFQNPWEIRVTCSNCSNPIGESSYFATQSNGGVMTTNGNSAFIYQPSRDHRNLTLSYPFTIENPRVNISPIYPLLLDD